ncbi:hypothetical protein BVD23_18545 [Salmonella enterica]|nr:hypothetical protein [Salmonella enterica]EAN4945619.1 hypothetical protein [Salmonella enterica]EBI7619328.1 hypothetical protein [Salmonella enterica]EBI8101523.1 hypothetical protein [Salmonella enterica]EBK3006578.1 hypothetical protein [Salmonella enterica]
MFAPSIYNQMKDNKICPTKNPDLKCGRHHDHVCPQTFRRQNGKQKGQPQHTPPSGQHAIAYSR